MKEAFSLNRVGENQEHMYALGGLPWDNSSYIGCPLGSDYQPRRVPQGQMESASPWDMLSVDVMGPFISSKKGEQYILSIIDCFSKYLILVPLRDHTAPTASRALYKRVVRYFGCPRKILSDRGTEFTGRIWGELMNLLGVQQVLTSPYYPQGNGIVERSHRTIHNLLRAHLSSREDEDWVDLLPGVMLTFNEMTQDQHGFTASQILLEQGMNLSVDLTHGRPAEGKPNTGGYVRDLRKRLNDIRRSVAPSNKRREEKRENPFKVGELILIFQQPMEREHKLSPKWRGPFPIVRIENPFQVQYEDRGREKIAHVRHCKKLKSWATDGEEGYVISNNDVIYNDSVNPQREGLGDDEEADDLLAPTGGNVYRMYRGNYAKTDKKDKKGVGHLGASLCPAVQGRCLLNTSRSASRALSELSWKLLLSPHG